MLLKEDRQALKKEGYKVSANGRISPIAHPLQQTHRKSFSSGVKLLSQGKRDSINNSRPIQPKASVPSRQPARRTQPSAQLLRAEGITHREWNNAQQPRPKPRSIQPSKAFQAFRQGERDFTNNPTKAIAPAGQQPANNRPLPRPTVSEPPKPQPQKSWWDKAGDFVKNHTEDIGHGVLDAAGFIPVVGAVADLANAGWYLAKGDKVNAALSAASAIPFAGDAFAAGKLAFKAAKGVEKLAEAGNVARKYTFDTRKIGAKPGKNLNSNQRRKTWRAMAEDPEAPFTEVQRQQIRNTPWHKSPAPRWQNPVTGKLEIMELSHEGKSFSRKVQQGSSRREGATDVVPRWPETHAQIDKHRHLPRDVREAYTSQNGIDKIRKAFTEEVKEWGYKVDDSKL
ncbi:hypothetical protein I8751_26265 [Nostocaceae cyanobacterium CENA357]|uniref:Uncharacterized protein n=1 Tax=Atlanticothrix silvestris CENA357 TaxID=1725252 RepID=A0A8J7HHS6_9CYAN|nr:hypothetical protein [Atlanticothrix silvestris]MBH8555788.1 hypothetical protein [Atlanticothrix silvestris CENA357]